MSSDNEFKAFIIGLTERLLNAINFGDYSTFVQLVDSNVTAFESGVGNLVTGLDFHSFYFDNLPGKKAGTIQSSIISPVVHRLSPESACIAYTKLTQSLDSRGICLIAQAEETRVWHNKDGKWKLIHFHCGPIYAPAVFPY